MKYKCQFCCYETNNRSQINEHHIIPRSIGGKDKAYNIVSLCPICHTRVFVPKMKNGIHSMKHDNSFIIHGKMLSTGGMIMSYSEIENDEVKYILLK